MQQINDLQARSSQYSSLITAAVNRVIASGWWVMGPECQRFEHLFARYLNVAHCIGVANGTDAIELALKAAKIEAGDLVATVANAGMYVTSSLLAIGASPLFMDVDPHHYCVTFAEVKRAVAAGVKAVVVTHLYGLAVPEIIQIAEFCQAHHIYLLEDCAQAHGAEIQGKKVGSFGNAATFSFYPTKNLGALGDGGAVVTNNDALMESVRHLKQYGWTVKYRVEIAGGRNSRLDEIQAAILAEFLSYLDEANARRREIAARYSSHLHHPLITLPAQYGLEYVAHLYVIRCEYRDELKEYLRRCDIAAEIHYPIPDYRQPIFGVKFSNIYLENTERLANEILTLPCYPEMSNDDVDRVIHAINGWQQ